ncbi:MAG: c-type cytochrome biogenesis protein CcmI, partial [Gammaproteobacteria bacterium]|nr:c-type cytochrome biogenesis protein CcmI [Gammaproteobacteria bacterium]
MNITFWILMILLLLLAIGMLVYPILKVRQSAALAYKESNLKINEDKLKELDLDLKEGRIDQAFYKAAREELDRELLIDIPAVSKETSAEHYSGTAKRHPALALMIAVFVPMLVLLLYLELGMHSAGDESFVASQKISQQQSTAQPSVEEMTRKLEAKLEKEGGTVQEWTMLGRAHKYSGNNELAAKAFAVALEKDTENAQLMLERAEVLALNNNRVFTAEARELVLKASALEPDNANTLWFAGVAEYQAGNFEKAINHLLQLLPQASGEEEVMQSIVSIIAKSRQELVAAGKEMPELEAMLGIKAPMVSSPVQKPAPATATVATGTAAANTRLQIAVDVNEDVRRKFDANDIVFVYAKAQQGPRMPLAVQRVTLGSLPATVVLDDSMAMVEGMNLSAYDKLQVSARVTKTASAIAQSGDFIGQLNVDSNNA